MKHRQQLDAFLSGVARYFEHLDDDTPELEVGAPYLIRNSERLGLDLTGMISVTGGSTGFVFFSATRSMLNYILLKHGELTVSERYLCDLVGEVANTISGNVRKVFGSDFHISAPKVIVGEIGKHNLHLDDRSYVVPLRWKSNAAQLIVSLDARSAEA